MAIRFRFNRNQILEMLFVLCRKELYYAYRSSKDYTTWCITQDSYIKCRVLGAGGAKTPQIVTWSRGGYELGQNFLNFIFTNLDLDIYFSHVSDHHRGYYSVINMIECKSSSKAPFCILFPDPKITPHELSCTVHRYHQFHLMHCTWKEAFQNREFLVLKMKWT